MGRGSEGEVTALSGADDGGDERTAGQSRSRSRSRSERKTCRSCGAEVVWLRHVRTGKMAPIDALPTATGNIVIYRDQGTYEHIPAGSGEREALRGWLHTNHFSTCPSAAHWKQRGSLWETGASAPTPAASTPAASTPTASTASASTATTPASASATDGGE
jgi:hypothetical protein